MQADFLSWNPPVFRDVVGARFDGRLVMFFLFAIQFLFEESAFVSRRQSL